MGDRFRPTKSFASKYFPDEKWILLTMAFEYFTVVNVYVSEKRKFGLMIIVFL